MTPKAGEAVLYTPCRITAPITLMLYGGPYDGETRLVRPDECAGNLVAVWPQIGDTCEAYEIAWRFTKQRGCTGIALRWVAQ